MINYREPLFRPPAEAESLIFQVAYGCPHNSCRFCMMYKTVPYQQRPPDEIIAEFRTVARRHPDERRIFLADADVMFMPFDSLKSMLIELNSLFPRLARVNIYANGSSILSKTAEELRTLRELKLNTLYMGFESGDDEVLKLVNKKESAGDMVKAVHNARTAGLKTSVMILLGLGGKKFSARHSELTAAALNLMQPELLSALRFIEVPGTRMFDGYETLSEYQAVEELKRIVEGLRLDKTVFRANHSSNPLPLEARFPKDSSKLLAEIRSMLESGTLDKDGPGRLPLFL